MIQDTYFDLTLCRMIVLRLYFAIGCSSSLGDDPISPSFRDGMLPLTSRLNSDG